MTRKFQRRIENFTCDACGLAVTGDGYTNHCPSCLTSKHVDNAPGDRASSCGGLMPPIATELQGGQYYVLQQCRICGFQRKNRVTSAEMPALIALARHLALKARHSRG